MADHGQIRSRTVNATFAAQNFFAFRMDWSQHKEKECLIKQEGFFLFIIFIAGCHLRIFPTWMIITSSGKAYEGKIHASSPSWKYIFLQMSIPPET